MVKKRVYVISAFPGLGKSYATKQMIERGIPVSDSDSSQFPKENFPANYIRHIKNKISEFSYYPGNSFIFVSSHKEVRDALIAEDISFYLFYPHLKDKQKLIDRYIERRSPKIFINLISYHFEEWVNEISNDDNIKMKYQTSDFIYDIIRRSIDL